MNFKKITRRQMINEIDMILGGFYQHFFLIGYIFSLIIIIMYFTIENHDIKLLEEFQKSRFFAKKFNEEK